VKGAMSMIRTIPMTAGFSASGCVNTDYTVCCRLQGTQNNPLGVRQNSVRCQLVLAERSLQIPPRANSSRDSSDRWVLAPRTVQCDSGALESLSNDRFTARLDHRRDPHE